jgi:hypothetical protein
MQTTTETPSANVAGVRPTGLLDVQTAPFELLCGCVAVVFSQTEEMRLGKMRPEQAQEWVHAAIRGCRRDRIVLADCEKCNGTGLVV